MAVKARFWVQKIEKVVSGSAAPGQVPNLNMWVSLAPVVRSTGQPGDGQNKDWSKYTPAGEVRMCLTAEGAQKWFEDRIGKDVSITFDDVE